MEAYSQLAGAQCTHRIGFAPWQDAGHRVPGRGAQCVPTAREPTTTFQTSRPHVGRQLTGDLGDAGGDAPAQHPVPWPGATPTCSESEKRNSIVYTHSSGLSQSSWSAWSTAGKPGELRPLHMSVICPWAIPPVWLPGAGLPRAVAALEGSPVGDSCHPGIPLTPHNRQEGLS